MVRAAALGLLLLASPLRAQDIHGHLQQWDDHQLQFEGRGLTRDFWLLSVIMLEGMWVTGYCGDFMEPGDRYQMPPNVPADIAEAGQQKLNEGLAAAARDNPTEGECVEAMQSMADEFRFIEKQTSPYDGQRNRN